MNVLAAANKDSKTLVGINDLLSAHYKKYGRSFFSRYDYEEVPSEGAGEMTKLIDSFIADEAGFKGKTYTATSGAQFTIAGAYNFDYTDPIDGSVSKKQGQVVTFSDGSRVVFRLSGTGSHGATVRMYVERYVAKDASAADLARPTAEGLEDLIDVALEFSNLKQLLGREKPTVITVCTILNESGSPTDETPVNAGYTNSIRGRTDRCWITHFNICIMSLTKTNGRSTYL